MMVFAVCRLQELGRKVRVALLSCFNEVQKAYGSINPMLNVESYNYGTLPSQVPIIWKMEDESAAEINSLLSTEISGSLRTSLIGVVEVKTKKIKEVFFLLSLQSCRQRMMSFALLVHSKSLSTKKVVSILGSTSSPTTTSRSRYPRHRQA